jgi:hypothetical protein
VVERLLAKEKVAGSNPVFRSRRGQIFWPLFAAHLWNAEPDSPVSTPQSRASPSVDRPFGRQFRNVVWFLHVVVPTW